MAAMTPTHSACKAALVLEAFPIHGVDEATKLGPCGACDLCKAQAAHRPGRQEPAVCVDCGNGAKSLAPCCRWSATGAQDCPCPKCCGLNRGMPREAPVELTDSQFETIRRCLAFGGNVGVTQGRLWGRAKADFINKVQATRMIAAGLLETRNKGGWYAGTYTPDHPIHPTAKGIAAYNAAVAKGA